jgi:CBS-domain-containing membrane protein
LSREGIPSAARKQGGDEPASASMRAGVDSVRPSAPVESVFDRLQGRGAATLYVTDPDGKIIGLLIRQALGEVMMIRAARPDWRFDHKA